MLPPRVADRQDAVPRPAAAGTVACLQFEKAELGVPAAQAEVDDLMQSLYGNVRGGGPRRIFAESADQLALEDADAAAKVPARPPPEASCLPALAGLCVCAGGA